MGPRRALAPLKKKKTTRKVRKVKEYIRIRNFSSLDTVVGVVTGLRT